MIRGDLLVGFQVEASSRGVTTGKITCFLILLCLINFQWNTWASVCFTFNFNLIYKFKAFVDAGVDKMLC